jgi:hypothetical protein
MVNYFDLLLSDFSYWENRKEYLELLERFINSKIDGRRFNMEFCGMWRVNRDKKTSWKEFLGKITSVKFNKLKRF